MCSKSYNTSWHSSLALHTPASSPCCVRTLYVISTTVSHISVCYSLHYNYRHTSMMLFVHYSDMTHCSWYEYTSTYVDTYMCHHGHLCYFVCATQQCSHALLYSWLLSPISLMVSYYTVFDRKNKGSLLSQLVNVISYKHNSACTAWWYLHSLFCQTAALTQRSYISGSHSRGNNACLIACPLN